MSQVIVTNDQLRDLRKRSADQEHRISKEEQFAPWRRSDVTGKDLFATAVGYAVVPILGLWVLLGGLAGVVLNVLKYIFEALGRVMGKRSTSL